MRPIALLTASLAILTACSPAFQAPIGTPTSATIIGRSTKVDGSKAYMRGVVAFGSSKNAWCSASILSDKLILTAAHCVDAKVQGSMSHLRVYVGTDVASADQRRVGEIRIHPDWSWTSKEKFRLGSDLAIVEFKGGLPAGFEPVELLQDRSVLTVDADIAHVGFGYKIPGDRSTFGTLRYVETKLAYSAAPQFDFKFQNLIVWDNQASYVALENYRGQGISCDGDSGGPSFIDDNGTWKQFGIASAGDIPCNKLAGLASVPFHYEWITRTMSEMGN